MNCPYSDMPPQPSEPEFRPRPRPGIIALVPILLVLITFLFWYQTWFGRPLTDQEMTQYLTDTSVPHKTQHALAQLADRIARGDASARRWYPLVTRLSRGKEPQLRLMAAWVMGQDKHSEEFHQALRELLRDPDPMVRRNAALALARFGDSSAAPELRLMLRHYARGSSGEEQVWEALRALYLVGGPEDIDDVQRLARGEPGMTERVRNQAALTADAIRKRTVTSDK